MQYEDNEPEYSDDECQPDCQLCGGQLVPLGVLGNLRHFTCRQCGMPHAIDTGINS